MKNTVVVNLGSRICPIICRLKKDNQGTVFVEKFSVKSTCQYSIKIRFFIFRLFSTHHTVTFSKCVKVNYEFSIIKDTKIWKNLMDNLDDVIASTKLVIPCRYTEFNSFRLIRRIASNSIQTFKEKQFFTQIYFLLTIREFWIVRSCPWNKIQDSQIDPHGIRNRVDQIKHS